MLSIHLVPSLPLEPAISPRNFVSPVASIFSVKQEVRPSAESENREGCVGGSSRGEVPFISQMSGKACAGYVVCQKGNSHMCHIYAIIYVKNQHTL